MIAKRQTLLRNLVVGDIFHAESANGASLICLAIFVADSVIEARTVPTQIRIRFDRQTGKAVWGNDKVFCDIDSIAPLPPDIHSVILGLDAKFSRERDAEQLKLSEAEKRALVFVDTYYASNQI